tara:strand:- start:1719 stop:2582 length:864 start_codon:yes stop_codon:yes gene_type:complete
MTAIRPADSALRDKIAADKYNEILNNTNAKYTEMDKYITNLESDILSIKDFEAEMLADKARGYDVGSSLDTLGFQKDSLQIDLDFFVHMKAVYIKKLYGDLHQYCDAIIEDALSIEDIPANFTRDQIKQRKFRNMRPYPPPTIENPAYLDADGNPVEGEPAEIPDPTARYDMNEIFALINCVTANLRELADDIGTFDTRISNATEKEQRGFNVGNLIMNLESQKQKLTLEFDGYITRLSKFLEMNEKFSGRCLSRIKSISEEIVSSEELMNQQAQNAPVAQQPGGNP